MRNDPRVRKGDRLLIWSGLAMVLGVLLRLTGII
jgi:hypothetical protein